METEYLYATSNHKNDSIKRAATLIQKGEVVAIPTETVYGLAADATNETAVLKIFQAKGRPADNPLIVHVATKAALYGLVADAPSYVNKLIDTFSPGPITYVLPSRGVVAPTVTAGLQTVGIRIPAHSIARQFLLEVGCPIAAPSANLSGKPSPTTAQHVFDDLKGEIAAILDGGSTTIGIESTVLDCTGSVPTILRPGTVTAAQIEQVVGAVNSNERAQEREKTPRSPGVKYTHYAPEIPLYLVKDKAKLLQLIAEKQKNNRVAVLTSCTSAEHIDASYVISLGDEVEEMVYKLYDILRTFTKDAFDLIICESPVETAETIALIDRLERAATRVFN